MNNKIKTRLCEIFKNSPSLMRNRAALFQVISATFGVEIDLNNLSSKDTDITKLSKLIDEAVLRKYFSTVWQPKTKQYKYSGLNIIDEINNMRPRHVLDLGCGYNEFKGKINNLIGVDPYNHRADVTASILQFNPEEKFDVVICLGSINFGSVDKIFSELEHAVNLTIPGGLLFFRANPGEQHEAPEAKWIDFFDWTPEFVVNVSKELNCDLLTLQQDVGNRFYFVLKRKG